MRPTTAGKKKTVGFSLTGTKIEPPDDYKYQQGITNKFSTVKSDFKVAKAKEFQTFQQLPKFSKPLGAIIHPPPHRQEMNVWGPDTNLQFDGAKCSLSPNRKERKTLPEHLAKPAIDEITLMKIREMSQNQSPQKTKKMSLGAQKEFKAEQKRKSEINFKIRRAEKNTKLFFDEVKKILSKPEEEIIIPEQKLATVQLALVAE